MTSSPARTPRPPCGHSFRTTVTSLAIFTKAKLQILANAPELFAMRTVPNLLCLKVARVQMVRTDFTLITVSREQYTPLGAL